MRRRIGSTDPFDGRPTRVGRGRDSAGGVVGPVDGGAVVDQADRARPGRRSAGAPDGDRRSVPASSSEVGVDGHRVVERAPAARRDHRGAMTRPARRPSARRRPRRPGRRPGPATAPGGRRRSAGDSRTLRLERASPSGSRTMGQPTTSTGQRQVGGHAPHHRQLLEVLRAEVGPARAGDGEQLGHHGGHAVEVARARRALPARRSRRRPRPSSPARRASDGYISRDGRGEDDVGAGLGDRRSRSPLERPRVVGEVVGVAELQRVDEDADGHHVALGAGPRR